MNPHGRIASCSCSTGIASTSAGSGSPAASTFSTCVHAVFCTRIALTMIVYGCPGHHCGIP